MSELSDYRRIVEKPMIAKYEAEIASLKQRLESAEEALRALLAQVDHAAMTDGWCDYGEREAARTFLQEQEKQNG